MENMKAVLFDFDGTLADTLGMWKEVNRIFFERRGIKFDERLIRFGGMSFSETAEYMKEYFHISDSLEAIKNEWRGLCLEMYTEKAPLKNKAAEFIRALKNEGLKVGIGTSNDRQILLAQLKHYGILSEIDAIQTCCEIGLSKPAPDVYLNLARQFKVLPDHCVVFEDTLDGVRAGKNAGMKVYALKEDAHKDISQMIQKEADATIDDFSYFEPYFGKLREIL